MRTLLMVVPDATDATSFYRAIGPFGDLKRNLEWSFMVHNQVNWAQIAWADVVFLQRPFTPQHKQIVDMIKANNKPVWVDFDDDLYSVPYSNRTHGVYNRKEVQNNITEIAIKADVITVSTRALRDVFVNVLKEIKKSDFDKEGAVLDLDKVKVVPNAYNHRLFKHYRNGEFASPNKLIAWRGSDTHAKDLLEYTSAIKHAMANDLTWTMNFVGSPFWLTIEELDTIPGLKETNVIVTESLDPIEFNRFLAKVRPSLFVVPLWDCPFNRSKSNIAWLEGIHAGAVSLVPDWPEWQVPGAIRYRNPGDFERKLLKAMRGEYNLKEMHAEGWDYVMSELRLDIVNESRREILLSLVGE